MIKLFLLTLTFLFIASCSALPLDDENSFPNSPLETETTKIPQEKGESKDITPFNQKIINSFKKKETWPLHAPEVIFQTLGRDLNASFTTLEMKSQPELFDYVEGELVQDGTLDDAVKSVKTVFILKKNAKGHWLFVSLKVFTECYRSKEAGRCL